MPGSGFGCGSGEFIFAIGGENGKTVSTKQHFDTSIGGSYYESYACFDFGTDENDYIKWQKRLWDYEVHSAIDISNRIWSGGIGGGGTVGTRYEDRWFNIPDCSQAGKGGIINYSPSSKIHAYNGSYITTKDSKDMTESERINTQALIYAQVGFNVKKIREHLEVKQVVSRTAESLVKEWAKYDNPTDRDINYSALTNYMNFENGSRVALGIGSGAGGFQEIDGNGKFNQIN